jgi:hypothetical protein
VLKCFPVSERDHAAQRAAVVDAQCCCRDRIIVVHYVQVPPSIRVHFGQLIVQVGKEGVSNRATANGHQLHFLGLGKSGGDEVKVCHIGQRPPHGMPTHYELVFVAESSSALFELLPHCRSYCTILLVKSTVKSTSVDRFLAQTLLPAQSERAQRFESAQLVVFGICPCVLC